MTASRVVALSRQKAFTLVELIIGMVVLSISLVLIYSVLIPQTRQGIDPIWQVRAVALATSLSNEILAKSYDENSDPVGNTIRCGEEASTLCTVSSLLGPESGETRPDYDDVDDFNGYVATGSDIISTAGFVSSVGNVNIYQGFQASIEVFYDQNLDGINDDDLDQNGVLDLGNVIANNKLIKVTITTPGDQSIVVTSVRGNF